MTYTTTCAVRDFICKKYFLCMMIVEMNTTLPIDLTCVPGASNDDDYVCCRNPASAPDLEDRVRAGNFGTGMSEEALEHLAIRLKTQHPGSSHAEIVDMLRDEVTRRNMAKFEHTTDAPLRVDGSLA